MAINKDDFAEVMNNTMKVDTNVFNQLRKINLKYFSIHVFEKLVKYDHTINKMTESWNVQLGDIRKAPIITLMEYIRKNMMQAIIIRKMKCQRERT